MNPEERYLVIETGTVMANFASMGIGQEKPPIPMALAISSAVKSISLPAPAMPPNRQSPYPGVGRASANPFSGIPTLNLFPNTRDSLSLVVISWDMAMDRISSFPETFFISPLAMQAGMT